MDKERYLQHEETQGIATYHGANPFPLATQNFKIDFQKELFVNNGPNRAERRRIEKERRKKKCLK